MATRSGERRAFLGGVLKLGAGAAALTVLPGCEVGEAGAGGRRGRRGKRGCNGDRHKGAPNGRVAQPEELFEPMTMGMVMEEKWRLGKILRRPDSHLRVQLIDVNTDNPLDIEIFRGPDPLKRAIATTDHWEFYTYNEQERGKPTPDHVKDAINQLAALVLDNEKKAAIANLNATVILFNDRAHDEPTPAEKPKDVATTK